MRINKFIKILKQYINDIGLPNQINYNKMETIDKNSLNSV